MGRLHLAEELLRDVLPDRARREEDGGRRPNDLMILCMFAPSLNLKTLHPFDAGEHRLSTPAIAAAINWVRDAVGWPATQRRPLETSRCPPIGARDEEDCHQLTRSQIRAGRRSRTQQHFMFDAPGKIAAAIRLGFR